MSIIQNYCTGLIEENGIFYAEKRGNISYPSHGNDLCYQLEDHSFWFAHRNRCIVEVVNKYSPNETFFDVGGGNGFISRGIHDNGNEVVLVEPGIKGCLNAKKRQLKNIICSTLENGTFKENSLPAIGLFDVVEHIENDKVFLAMAYNLLADNGLVYITVPAYNLLWSKEDTDAGHFKRYTRKQMAFTLKEVGFDVKFSSYIFTILPLPIFLFRTIPSWLGLSGKIQKSITYEQEHSKQKGFVSKFFERLWDFELNRIRVGAAIPFGASILIVAKKI